MSKPPKKYQIVTKFDTPNPEWVFHVGLDGKAAPGAVIPTDVLKPPMAAPGADEAAIVTADMRRGIWAWVQGVVGTLRDQDAKQGASAAAARTAKASNALERQARILAKVQAALRRGRVKLSDLQTPHKGAHQTWLRAMGAQFQANTYLDAGTEWENVSSKTRGRDIDAVLRQIT